MLKWVLLLSLLAGIVPVFGQECDCIKEALTHKEPGWLPSDQCRTLLSAKIGPIATSITPAQMRTLGLDPCLPPKPSPPKPAAPQVKPIPVMAEELQNAVKNLQNQLYQNRLDAKSQIDKLNERIEELRDTSRQFFLLAVAIGGMGLVGSALAWWASGRKHTDPGVLAVVQYQQTLHDRLLAQERQAEKTREKSTAIETRISQLAEQISTLGARPNLNGPQGQALNAGQPWADRESERRMMESPRGQIEAGPSGDPLVTSYNAAARSRRGGDYLRFESAQYESAYFTVTNARERAQNRDLPAIFGSADTGPYFAVLNPHEGAYCVFPSLGKHPWGLRKDAAMSDVFEFPPVSGEPDLGVKTPAIFRRNGEEWLLVRPGALEIL